MQHLKRPYVCLKTAMSLDGYIDDLNPVRLILSSPEDMQAVDQLKSTFDAVFVGAETVRRDNPSLLVKSADYRAARRKAGLQEDPVKVTLTATGRLDPGSRFFITGTALKLVYCPQAIQELLQKKLANVATVVGLSGAKQSILELVDDLAQRGISRLLVEGGGKINRLFLAAGLVDALRVAVAPFFVGDPRAPQVIAAGLIPQELTRRMKLEKVEVLGDVVILFYSVQNN